MADKTPTQWPRPRPPLNTPHKGWGTYPTSAPKSPAQSPTPLPYGALDRFTPRMEKGGWVGPAMGIDQQGGGGASGTGTPAVDPLEQLMNEQIGATTEQLKAAYAKLYGDLYGQLNTENASEQYQLYQTKTAEEQALEQLESSFASRGMTRSGAYMKEQAETLEQMKAQRDAILGQYASAHAAISARLGMSEDKSNLVKNETTGMMEVRAIDPATGLMTDKVLAWQDPNTGVWTLSEGSGLYGEWMSEQATKEAEIRRQYGMAGLPNS